MIVYINDPKISTKEVLQLINTFSNVAGYKSNSKKSVALRYTDDKWAEKEIRQTAPFTIATNNIKYLGKNFKSLKKKLKKTSENVKMSHVLG